MRSRSLRLTPILALCALLAPSSAAADSTPASRAAGHAPITGVAARGMTILAVDRRGRSRSARADARGRFSVRPPARSVTLHLRDGRGRYAGPVVAAGRGSRVVVGVRAGARLGRLVVSRGIARPVRAVDRRHLDRSRTARARHGVPLGAGRLGLRRLTRAGASASRLDPSSPGDDTDGDGLPNLIDIDDNGNGVIDAYDPAAQGGPPSAGSFTQMFLTVDKTVNVNADPGSAELIDRRMREQLTVVLTDVEPGTSLDCGGLSWCSPGGTGRLEQESPDLGPTGGDPFPGADSVMPLNERGEFRLQPGAGSLEIRAGDTLIKRDSTGVEIPVALGFVFTTVPALRSWSESSGDGGIVSYPASSSSIGTFDNPLIVRAGPDGRHVLTLELWRPQRRAIAGAEPPGLVDIGHLAYEVNVPQYGVGHQPGASQSVTSSSPELRPTTDGRLLDSSGDGPADASRTLTLTIDLTRHAQDRGRAVRAGELLNLDIGANALGSGSVDHANQMIIVRTD